MTDAAASASASTPPTTPDAFLAKLSVAESKPSEVEDPPGCTTVRRLGSGSAGTIYLMRRDDGLLCVSKRVPVSHLSHADQEKAEREAHMAVDVVLYFFSPHRCKGVDLAFLRQLRGRASIVPVLAKADTMTVDELAAFRREVTEALELGHVPVAHPPVAIICSSAGAQPRGRVYPWGVALSEDGVHSELPQLRRFLLIDGLLPLKQASSKHYEAFRSRRLRRPCLGRRA